MAFIVMVKLGWGQLAIGNTLDENRGAIAW
jgi:hypothetical protein